MLFNHACRVAPDDPAKECVTSIHIPLPSKAVEEDDNGEITVIETVLPNVPAKESPPPSRLDLANAVCASLAGQWRGEGEDEEEDEPISYIEPTLCLEMESIVVLNINGVEYACNRRNVLRHRATDREGGEA